METLTYSAKREEVDDEVYEDPACNANNPQTIGFEDITSAAFKIKNGVITTPCTKSHLSDITGMDIYLKQEFLQYTGSFKERGARYALLMLAEESKQKGVISASLGNHAQALSYHGFKLGIPVTVVMPVVAPIMKIQKCKKYNATVVVQGKDMGEAKKIAMRIAKEKGFTYINGYDHPHIMAGQGTIGLEIFDQVEDIDAVIVPTGGGGLIAGIGLALKTLNPNIKIIGVESERCSSFSKAMEVGRPVHVDIQATLADGLAVPMVGYNAFATARPLIDKLVVVKEEFIALAILRLIELEKCVVEGAGAAGLAAILAGELNELKGKRVVLNLCGGNIDTTILGRCLERGLAAEGRLIKVSVTVSDRPGGISELCKLISSIGVSIKDILHERAWVTYDVFSVEVKVMCETRDYEHAIKLKKLLSSMYKKVEFIDFPTTDIINPMDLKLNNNRV
ncbi:PREDICTED: L-threonine ammonia-lyase isoform X2 [Nicrophorus vespilloides]|uniref:L-serine deaminase n=1 Tax=Nicrophorus vespilloides TaxID=110193 RepID=A0ABM1MWD1_NICVS|nr:PREDICTED: L-threonine ammonia-lyase isoform X2 [Nicrophorus vespilloides]